MVNAEKLFSETELIDIETSIVSAEDNTSAEIVVAVATESGRYDRGECHFGVVVAVLVLVLANLGWATFGNAEDGSFLDGIPIYWQLAIVVAGYCCGMIAASYDSRLRMLLGTDDEVVEEVSKGARLVFLEQVLSSERQGGAVLIYVSLAECRVAVMVDDRIKAACGDKCSPMINDVQSRVGRLMGEGSVSQAIVEGVELAASRLKQEVPYREDDINELPNHVVLIHPRP